ncbi:hypothetical protein P175DRAFT_0473151 [Aspergillus ochraceoroseus IBT 24754]|uniref:Uncharacterized protein n=1 Tax=Aspergillus ochraceoroseus IBT 24754 TaxID=1392256 RepID=A0A2T5M1D1_9EURO|nr:uncharacterized protein P175DRAFT_0473151 [Aspergillus ochraceoroseus IBT 24754]PTU22337.1 hypothetical protein P175DRAFT_0473151 [Aspergillus ochraceoroseus IBT 24754]
MDLRGKAIRGIAAGIGLASESISAHKASKREKKERESQRSVEGVDGQLQRERLIQRESEREHFIANQHEQVWELDEAQDELHAHEQSNEEAPSYDAVLLAEEFIRNVPPPAYAPSAAPRLPWPVILPQRRPKSRKRGFVRAYAPVLEDFGIDQAMFLNFLETSNRACLASPWIYALNLATIPTMFLPSGLSIVVSTLIQIGTDVAIAVEGRRKTNTFFDKINEEFFRPRGLFCLVMTWDPESSSTFTQFNLNTTISTAVEHGGPGFTNKLKHKLKSSDGKTAGELPFPEAAPLIFPDLDDDLGSNAAEGKLKGTKKRKEFVDNYLDRRSQAKFIMENPDSALNLAPKPKFTSRYADPTHPASSGDFLGLITGGKFTSDNLPRRAPPAALGRSVLPDQRGRHGRDRRFQESGPGGNLRLGSLPAGNIVESLLSRRTSGSTHRNASTSHDRYQAEMAEVEIERGQTRQRQPGPPSGGIGGGIQKLLKSKVLYLMIVNMPSEEELAEARAMLNS